MQIKRGTSGLYWVDIVSRAAIVGHCRSHIHLVHLHLKHVFITSRVERCGRLFLLVGLVARRIACVFVP